MTYKYCLNCGKQIPRTAKFCPFCDAKQAIKSVPKARVGLHRPHDQPRFRISGDQISLLHHRTISPFNMKIITLVTVMMDVIVMVLFSSSWESIAANVRNIGSAPVVIYILFTLWTAAVEYVFGEHMSKRYNDFMLCVFGIMGIMAFAFLVAGTTLI